MRCWLIAVVVGYWSSLIDRTSAGFPGLVSRGLALPIAPRRRRAVGVGVGLRDPRVSHRAGVRGHGAGLRRAVTRPGDGWVPLMWAAFAVGPAAVTLELAADIQMHRFVARRRAGLEASPVMCGGLWAWSYPNYLSAGVLGFWLSMAMFGAPRHPVSGGVVRRVVDGRDVPRRQYPDDGEAQSGASPALLRRSSSGCLLLPCPPRRRAGDPSGVRPRVVIAGLRQRPAHRHQAEPVRRCGGSLGQTRSGQRSGNWVCGLTRPTECSGTTP